ncbi:MAG: NAD-dependent epimerase/dehydratase family protein [Fodinibius sp.]|nr:NAD-dependent epimerase/dehydratase family protein [Fodinibius sp.]MDZ7659244.1 NAD-dependent epimerase/dehydratase family protein [Fodinibius sp.]
MNSHSKIYIAGHRGMVGSAIKRRLEQEGAQNIIFRSSSELDLRDQQSVDLFFEEEQPDIVIDAAARVGGIMANNNYPWQFLYDNIQMQSNIINCSHKYDVNQLIFSRELLYISQTC